MQYFKLFNSCRIVKGAENALIYDLERVDNSNSIPGSLYEMLTQYPDKSIQDIKSIYHHEYDDVIDEYISFLVANEYIFYCTEEEISLFPTVDFEWKSSSTITNSIIDFDGSIPIKKYAKFVKELSDLNCEAIQFRSYTMLSESQLEDFFTLFKETSITCLELVLKFNNDLNDSKLERLRKKYPRFTRVSFYNSTENRNNFFISHSEKNIIPDQHCGVIESKYFSIGFETFSEAQKHNTCLNRKISLDKNGLIKGCPSMDLSHGKIGETTIREVLDKGVIQKKWEINKDEIEICKDCEYRYCCTDCRVFTDDVSSNYSRPSKCSYNPYLGLWEGESGYVEVNKWLKNNKVM